MWPLLRITVKTPANLLGLQSQDPPTCLSCVPGILLGSHEHQAFGTSILLLHTSQFLLLPQLCILQGLLPLFKSCSIS